MTRLQDLEPNERQNVKDLVASLGIPWQGTVFDWCFGTPDGPNVVFQWFTDLVEENGQIYFVDGSRDYANENYAILTPQQRNRAYAVYNLINTAYLRKLPIHVAIVDGTTTSNGIRETSHASKRVLDHELWYPHHIDPVTNRIVVLRGIPQPADFDPQASYIASLSTNDASSQDQGNPTPEPNADEKKPETQTSLTTTYTRDPEIARKAKLRASDGRCEFCGELGFETAQGGYYLEAHHVIPRNCDGPDEIWNVAAICANDHKRAHFGHDRKNVRDTLIQKLAQLYPDAADRLVKLAAKMDASGETSEKLEDPGDA
jgi:5-methylcytosine-specific restriction enzyme A